MTFKNGLVALCLFFSFQLFQSCSTGKKVNQLVYFSEPGDSTLATAVQNAEPFIRAGDRLSIVINALNPTSAAPYNLASSTTGTSGATNGGYLVDADGKIHMPQLGKIEVAGMKRKQLINLLTTMLVKYVNDPVVMVEFLNFKITVLGEVGNPGSFHIPDGKATLIDAISLAGDLPMTAQRDNITVIREKNGKREFGKVNLLTKNVFSSPYFVLQQNDVVYVELTKEKAAASDSLLVLSRDVAFDKKKE